LPRAGLFKRVAAAVLAAHAEKKQPTALDALVALWKRGYIVEAPRGWAEKVYPKLSYFNEASRGGHFAAWEEPELFAAEMRASFRSLR
jgi:hypothetical protein